MLPVSFQCFLKRIYNLQSESFSGIKCVRDLSRVFQFVVRHRDLSDTIKITTLNEKMQSSAIELVGD